MNIYVNKNGEIKDVDTTSDTTLTPITLNDKTNIFKGWNTAKICCYKVEIKDGKVVSCSPYIDNNIIKHIDDLAKSIESNSSDIIDNQLATVDVYEKTLITDENITELELALTEIYELMLG